MKERIRRAMVSPYRFFAAAAILAALFSMLPTQADAPDAGGLRLSMQEEQAAREHEEVEPGGVPAGADLSERTHEGTYLHRTMRYACGHSVQRRESMPSPLRGLTQAALDAQIVRVIPGAKVTGFSVQEVDIAQAMDMPCPLHWVLRLGENGRLEVLQNVNGEALSVIRDTQITLQQLGDETLQELLGGVTFDDVQALEGYMESLSS